MTYLRKLQIALDLFCLYEIGMAIVWIFMDIANGGTKFVAGYGYGSPGISTTDVVIGLFYICK